MQEYQTQIQNQSEYKDVDIIGYIKLINKRKRLIFTLFLVTIIGGGVYTFFIAPAPEVYKNETILEIGSIEFKGERSQIIEEVSQVIEKIRTGFYGDYPKISVSNPERTNLVKIEIRTQSSEDGKKILENINKAISADHDSKIDFQKKILEKQKEKINSTIENLREDAASLILRGQDIAALRLEVYRLQLEIERLDGQIESFQSTKIIKEPTSSEESVKVRLVLNVVIAGFLGIFLGVFLVFGKEWWEKNKERLQS